MKFYSKKEIYEIVEQFRNKSLPKANWTHEAHIIVALWHNLNFEFETAYKTMKLGIISYNEAVCTPNTDSSGYTLNGIDFGKCRAPVMTALAVKCVIIFIFKNLKISKM